MTSYPSRSLAALALAVGFGLTVGCRDRGTTNTSSGAGSTGPVPVRVTLVPVTTRAIERTVEITGTLLGQEEATISSKIPGRVVEIVRDLGDVAQPGDTLARIDPREFELALAERCAMAAASLAKLGLTKLPGGDFDPSGVPTVERARAEASNAEAKLDRATRLFEQTPPLISAQDHADIATARDVARSQAEVELMTAQALLAEARAQTAAMEVARQRLRDTAVTAPGMTAKADGVNDPKNGESISASRRRYRVSERMVSEGEYVTEGRQLFRLVSSDVIRLRAHAPERFAAMIEAGQRATVITDSSPSPVSGLVSRVAPAVDPASRAFAVEIEVANSGGSLKPGAFARGRVVTQTDQDVVLVPQRSVVSFAGIDRVFSVRDGKAVEHRVRLGQTVDGLVEVVGGLPATHVIEENAATIESGAMIQVQEK